METLGSNFVFGDFGVKLCFLFFDTAEKQKTKFDPRDPPDFQTVNDSSGLSTTYDISQTRTASGDLPALVESDGDLGPGGLFPEDGTDGSLLLETEEQLGNPGPWMHALLYQTAPGVYLQDFQGSSPYRAPNSIIWYSGGATSDLGMASLEALVDQSTFGITSSTNAATTAGLPNQEASALGNMAQNQGPPDGVSRSAPPSPTAVLTVLAAAGRNPTDLTIPTVGSQAGGSGGDSPDSAVTTVTASPGGITADGTGSGGGSANGSHESPWWEGTKAFGASLWGSTGGAVYSIATGEAGTALGNRAVAIVENQTGQAFTGTASDYATFGRAVAGDMVGTNQIAEAGVGYDLATQQQLPTEERIRRGAAGTAAVAFTVAGGLEMASPRAVVAGETVTAEVATAEVASAEIATAEAATESTAVQAMKGGPCFAAGTPLRTPDGSQPIESFQKWDLLLSRHEDDPEGPVIAKRILKVIQSYAPLLDLHVGGRVIRTTAEHPFWVAGRGWVPAQQIVPSDRLLGTDGEETLVTLVDGPKASEPVYNLAIEDYHTYLVGGWLWGFSIWRITIARCQPEALLQKHHQRDSSLIARVS